MTFPEGTSQAISTCLDVDKAQTLATSGVVLCLDVHDLIKPSVSQPVFSSCTRFCSRRPLEVIFSYLSCTLMSVVTHGALAYAEGAVSGSPISQETPEFILVRGRGGWGGGGGTPFRGLLYFCYGGSIYSFILQYLVDFDYCFKTPYLLLCERIQSCQYNTCSTVAFLRGSVLSAEPG